MAANEIPNRMHAAGYIKAGAPGDDPSIADCGWYFRANAGFEDQVRVLLPNGVTPSDDLEDFTDRNVIVFLENDIARGACTVEATLVAGIEPGNESPPLYGQTSGSVLVLPLSRALAQRIIDTGGNTPPFSGPPATLADADPIGALFLILPNQDNGTDLTLDVWSLPQKGGITPPAFFNAPVAAP
jgi:hypothetical protein